MSPFLLRFVREPLLRSTLSEIAANGFGDMIKVVVDIRRAIMVVGAVVRASVRNIIAALVRDS